MPGNHAPGDRRLPVRMTTKGRYALRAIIALAKLYNKNKMVSINTLSEEEDISSLFLEQIFFKPAYAPFQRPGRRGGA